MAGMGALDSHHPSLGSGDASSVLLFLPLLLAIPPVPVAEGGESEREGKKRQHERAMTEKETRHIHTYFVHNKWKEDDVRKKGKRGKESEGQEKEAESFFVLMFPFFAYGYRLHFYV